jgi:predicted O-linked N-acetylglucosamine transferase (SPINDLY family)
LLIKNKQLSDPSLCDRIAGFFEKKGVDKERLTLMGKTDKSIHMSACGSVDIALDTYPYNGTTTTCDTLWMGVPVISLIGKTHVSRVAASILNVVGLEQFICQSRQDYINCATNLANNIDELTELRKGMRERMKSSRLCDAFSFAREYEAMLDSVRLR